MTPGGARADVEQVDWRAIAAAGGVIPRAAAFVHRASGQTVPLAIAFSKPRSGLKLADELADFELSPGQVTCRMARGAPVVLWSRLSAMLAFILPCLGHSEREGHFSVSLGDEGAPARVLAFSSNIPDYLVPDPDFLHRRGYLWERQVWARAPDWAQRTDLVYWRGADTGVWRYRDIAQAPRVAAALLSRARPDLIDARITKVQERGGSSARRAFYEAHALLGQAAPQDEILNYRYQLDIDGNASAWSGLFLKLMSGSPVLKVHSDFHWRQWYHGGLRAGIHYVPLRADLSDLARKLEWLRANPAVARRIGEAARTFVLSLTYETELRRGAETLQRLLRFNRMTIATPEATDA